MDVVHYYITTLTAAATKLGPLVLFLVGGYLIFVKLPFWFFLRNMNISKKKFEEKLPEDFQKDYSIENYKDFQRRMKLTGPPKEEKKTEQKKEERREETRQERKKEEPKKEIPKVKKTSVGSPEEIFKIRPGEKISKEDLRKRYHELLKMNHPDKVAALGEDFKKLAEQNTKEINKAYDKLKSKAA